MSVIESKSNPIRATLSDWEHTPTLTCNFELNGWSSTARGPSAQWKEAEASGGKERR